MKEIKCTLAPVLVYVCKHIRFSVSLVVFGGMFVLVCIHVC